jgi:hypothetical protein
MGTKKTSDPRDGLWADKKAKAPAGIEALARLQGKTLAQGIAGTPEAYAAALEDVQATTRLVGDAELGRSFKTGRKAGAGGPIRAAIAKALKKNPRMTSAALWDALAAKPPRGWVFRENDLGKYAEGPQNVNMNWARFQNVCSEERKKLAP